MRHGKRFNHLSRTSAHRKAMLANMASSLIIHKRIKTTVAKAKALRTYIEPLITKSKTDSTHSRRVVFSYLNDKDAVTELFREISVKVADRPGGYTRIIKIGARMGDNAEMALIELVDYNENLLDAKAKGPKKTRRRRGGKKQEEGAEVAEQAVETAEEAVEDASEEEKEGAAAETTEEVKEEAEAEEVKIEEVKEEPKEEVKEEPKAEEVKIEEVKEEEVKPTSAEATVDKEAVAEVKEEPEEEEKPASDEAPEDEEKKDKKE
ncbi:MAG: 50S ribosomal protein L17 [Bacteroidales bacterium]|nr:50S ribosomal protein L17 [Bacteroidales bacterium]